LTIQENINVAVSATTLVNYTAGFKPALDCCVNITPYGQFCP